MNGSALRAYECRSSSMMIGRVVTPKGSGTSVPSLFLRVRFTKHRFRTEKKKPPKQTIYLEGWTKQRSQDVARFALAEYPKALPG